MLRSLVGSEMCIRDSDSTWASLGPLVCKLQCLVLMDLLHAGVGMWPSDESIGLIARLWCKVGHRSEIFVTIAILQNAAAHWTAGPLILTWAMADVSRYQLYFLRSIGKQPPGWLAWMRYSDFIVQYPLNLIAEAAFILHAAPHLAEQGYGWLSYAPIALAFQVYEWAIFVPAFRTLWKIRKRRLGVSKAAWTMPSAHCLGLHASQGATGTALPLTAHASDVVSDKQRAVRRVGIHQDGTTIEHGRVLVS
eukprot:TRINITY_DN19832_c0_g1_i1.p1 TRINITY_DN19832_c0_g1~~TRINITY_DN19832_c0_g1_i1.p1  ORF type:complete len:250 (+),score=42.84 TRINITY_DN19832_c0_g1_i1:139-888(+)